MKRHFTGMIAIFLLVGSLVVVGCDDDGAEEADGATEQQDDSTDEAAGTVEEEDGPVKKFAASQAAMFEATNTVRAIECECREDWDDRFYGSEEECLDDLASDDDIDEFERCLFDALQEIQEDPPAELADAGDCLIEAAEGMSNCKAEVRSDYDDVCEEFEDAQEDLTRCVGHLQDGERQCIEEYGDALDDWLADIEEQADDCFSLLM